MISAAEFLAVLVLAMALTGGSLAWFFFVRTNDRERRERERRLAEWEAAQRQAETSPISSSKD